MRLGPRRFGARTIRCEQTSATRVLRQLDAEQPNFRLTRNQTAIALELIFYRNPIVRNGTRSLRRHLSAVFRVLSAAEIGAPGVAVEASSFCGATHLARPTCTVRTSWARFPSL